MAHPDYQSWDRVIESKPGKIDLRLREVLGYKDLLLLFVKRDVVTIYKQTILGPLWFIIQPMMTMAIYVVVFNKIAGLSTDGIPAPLFYLAGIVIWNYFAECFRTTSDTFRQNVQIFSKVYFPRVILPVSKVISSLIKFAVQLILVIGCFLYFFVRGDISTSISWNILMIPFIITIVGFMGLGIGLLFSSLTTKYRDLNFLIQFGIQILMYATPVIYPISSVGGNLRRVLEMNPMSSMIETFKYAALGVGYFSIPWIAYSIGFTIILLLLGLIVFNRTERNFVDTV